METNENENTSVQNLWDTAKVVLRGKYIAIQKMHKLNLHLKDLEKEQQIRPKSTRRREIKKIREEACSLKELIRSINLWPDLSKRKEK